MAKELERMIFQFDEQGGFISTNLGKGEMTKPTHNLYNNPPTGEYVGSMELGKIYVYRQPDGALRKCYHFGCRIY
jgi:hypothetical protein